MTNLDSDSVSKDSSSADNASLTSPNQPVANVRVKLGVLPVAAVLLAVCGAAFEAVGVVSAMPKAAEALGQLELYAWTFTAVVGGQILAIGLSGRFCDLFGPVKPLLTGLLVFALGTLLAGCSPNMAVLIVARASQGIGIGAMNLAMMVLVGKAFNPKEQAKLMTAFSFCWVFPSIIGPTLAAWVSKNWSWHWVFWLTVPPLFAAFFLGCHPLIKWDREYKSVKLTRQSTNQTSRAPWWASLLVAFGAACLQAGGQKINWLSLLWIAAAAVLLFFGLPRVMPSGFAKIASGMASVVWVRGLQAGGYFAAESFMTLMLTTQRGLSLEMAGVLITAGSIGWALGSWAQQRPWMRIRRDQIVSVGALFLSLGLAILALFVWWGILPLPVAVIGWLFANLGLGLSFASQSLVTIELSKTDELGYNLSSLQLSEGLGNSVVTGLAGTIFATAGHAMSTAGSFSGIYLICLISGALSILASLRIGAVKNHSANIS